MKMERFIILAFTLCTFGCATQSNPDENLAVGSADSMLSSACPDLSGHFAGTGVLIKGDATAQQAGGIRIIDGAFPIGDTQAWTAMQAAYRRDKRGILIAPDSATVARTKDGQYVVSTYYEDQQIGRFSTGFDPQTQVSCDSGVLHWTAAGETARSDFGPNHVATQNSLSLDALGDLIYKRTMQVTYHMALGIPLGTSQFYREYRFKRVSR